MLVRSRKKILCLFLFLVTSCREVVVHDLDELRANQLKLILENNEIAVSKERVGSLWQISIASNQVRKALAIIEKSRILLRDVNRFKEQSKNILQTREEKNQLLLKELAWSLEQTLERYFGVLEARVHLNSQVTPDFINSTKPQTTAAILLMVKEKVEVKEAEIKQIISGASGIATEKIAVIVSEQKMPILYKDENDNQKQYFFYWTVLAGIFLTALLTFFWKKRIKGKQKSDISENTDRQIREEEFLIKSNDLVF